MSRKYRYSLAYRRDVTSKRTHHLSVVARDADEARDLARLVDPEFLYTVKSPQRRAVVIEVSE